MSRPRGGRRVGAGVAVLVLAGALLAALPAASATDLAGLRLRDQFGVEDGLREDADNLQIAIVVSAKRLRRLKPWEEALWKYDETLEVLRVADVPRTAPTEYDPVAAKLRRRLPEDVNVLVDLEGVWVKRFDLDSSAPTVLVFGRGGELLGLHHGMYNRARFEALREDLEALKAGVAQAP